MNQDPSTGRSSGLEIHRSDMYKAVYFAGSIAKTRETPEGWCESDKHNRKGT